MSKATYILNRSAITFLVLVCLVCLFSRQIIGALGLDQDVHLAATNLSPTWDSGYLFGSDNLGRNVLAMVISGAKSSMAISVLAALFATTIGVVFGAIAGFFGDQKLRVSRAGACIALLAIPLIGYYFSLAQMVAEQDKFWMALGLVLVVTVTAWILSYFLKKIPFLSKPVSLPIDVAHTKVVELFMAVPAYFILLALSGLFQPSVSSLVVIISIMSWPSTALLVRGEMLKIREMDFILAQKLAGIPWYRSLVFHAIPNAIEPALVNMVFLASGLLVVESTLSFIGIGLPNEIISWGKILGSFRFNTSNWWVILFPGLVIFSTILCFHRLGKMLKNSRR